MVNPFDPKAALLAKHAQHVVLIHFPIALFLTGFVFDLTARWTKNSTKKATMAVAGRLNILAAAVAVVPTLASGIAAWQWQLAGQKPKGLLLLHLVLGLTSSLLICWAGAIHFRQQRASNPALSGYYLPLELLTAVILALTAHLGGFLSGVNVPG